MKNRLVKTNVQINTVFKLNPKSGKSIKNADVNSPQINTTVLICFSLKILEME